MTQTSNKKEIKCPVCGNIFDLCHDLYNWDSSNSNYNYTYRYVCHKCGLTSFWGSTEEEALSSLKELIREFPPVMRLVPGDTLSYFDNLYHIKIGEVVKVDRNSMRIQLEDGSSVLPEAIYKWPWDLKNRKLHDENV